MRNIWPIGLIRPIFEILYDVASMPVYAVFLA